jgi:hypothetical protein
MDNAAHPSARGRSSAFSPATEPLRNLTLLRFFEKGQCQSRVKSAVLSVGRPLPVFPDKRTFAELVGMSQKCQ